MLLSILLSKDQEQTHQILFLEEEESNDHWLLYSTEL